MKREALLKDLHATRVPSFPNAYLPTFKSVVEGGEMTPHWIVVGVMARGDLFRIYLYFFNNFKAYVFNS